MARVVRRLSSDTSLPDTSHSASNHCDRCGPNLRATSRLARHRRCALARRPIMYSIRGFRVEVENTRPDIETSAVLARLDGALALIERYQPWRLAHLRRDLAQFWIVRYPCRGAYFPDTRTCMTELTFLARTDITAAPVAASILHEGMHARVHAAQLHPASRDLAREERICRRAELDFGLALPPALGEPVVERARASLELEDEEVA